MIILNRERIKSVSLLFLVILSFVLTTRIWFYTSIEGVFIMSGNKSIKPDYNAEYDKSDLLRPHKLIVSFGERSTLLYDNEEYSEAYGRIFKEAKRVMRTAILVNSKEVVKKIPMEELYKIRNARGITFIYNLPLEMEAVYKLMNINSYPGIGIRGIDEIIVAQSLDRAYLCDSVQGILYEYRTEGIQNNLDYLISNLEKQPTVLSLYLDSIQPEMYGKNSVVPTRISEKRFPVLSGQKEVEGSDEIPESIAGLFDDEITSLSIIKNMDGTIVYTNREGQVVKLYTDGMLEYVNFNLQPEDKTTVGLGGAIDISTEFVSRHFGFPEDCYISDIIRINSMGDD
ncbi:MAG TPA: two-component system activity regulator YycH, partial [Bacillota bacterium]|nr:two-component system activity regulator YycH [Bacillota bacterium]